jgi:tripartite-type tricarboxylate transporter receptor subunit TctC
MKRCLVLLVAVALFTSGCSALGLNQGSSGPAYPTRAVTMIVPYAAGGSTDLMARKVAEMAKAQTGQPFEVVNRAGGSATVGVSEALRAAPDGYTLAYATSAAMAIQPNMADSGYKGPADYVPVAKIASGATVVIVKADSQFKDMRDFVAYAKAHPGELRVGVATRGGVGHLDLEELKETAGAQFTFVPLGGGGESIPAVLGGHIEATTTSAASVQGHVQAGTIRILGIPSDKRTALFPEVQTFKEQGFDVTRSEYHVIVAPKGTPDKVAQTLQDMVKKITDDPAFKKFAEDNGQILDYKDMAGTRAQLETDYAFYGPVVQKLGLAGS